MCTCVCVCVAQISILCTCNNLTCVQCMYVTDTCDEKNAFNWSVCVHVCVWVCMWGGGLEETNSLHVCYQILAGVCTGIHPYTHIVQCALFVFPYLP